MDGYLSRSRFVESAPGRAGHFAVLDGMRGVAAFIVLVFHMNYAMHLGPHLPHAHLAVDFFFMLSGFVVAKAYEARLKTSMGFFDFMAVRLARLYPMIFMGALMGAFVLMIRALTMPAVSAQQLATAIVSGFLLLPTTAIPAVHPAYPVNGAYWSLFFELAVNFVYAAAVRHLTNRRLVILCAVSGLALCAVGAVNHSIAVGYATENFLFGFARVTFSFTLGVLLFRCRPAWRINGWAGMGLTLLLTAVLVAPIFAECWFYEWSMIALVFPPIIAFGSICETGPVSSAVCRGLGELSYPLYATHIPVLLAIAKVLGHLNFHPAPVIVIVASSLACLLVAALLLKTWEQPVRKWLAGVSTKDALRNVQTLPTAQ